MCKKMTIETTVMKIKFTVSSRSERTGFIRLNQFLILLLRKPNIPTTKKKKIYIYPKISCHTSSQ